MNISLSGIKKNFGSLQALRDIHLQVKSGEFVTLLGPSGCGKTTLLRILAGLEEADEGNIRFDDSIIFSAEEKRNVSPQKRQIGMVFQDFALWPHMTVFENVAYGLRARGIRKGLGERVTQALGDVQLEKHASRYPHQLSGGQQQRVAFARAVAANPKLILLDEPLSALDAALRVEMRILLQKLVKKHGLTAVYVTHDQHEAMSLSDRIVVLKSGEILQTGAPEEIYRKPVDENVASFIGHGSLIPVAFRKKEMIVENQYVGPWDGVEEKEVDADTSFQAIIRPEQVAVYNNSGPHRLLGVVQAVSFLGERYELNIQLKNSDYTLMAYSGTKHTIGEDVYCSLDTGNIHILSEKERSTYHETA
ncbi:ABC transporter ATP-binding protein [Alteribacillus iranensis]|uniref:Carnitine transport ATP-binding protein OpuCA n=1 Tax=Alteribacillus iranensis TaxID=930128 RepID=A0A1I2DI19_9BACI|nr:ABC transporter ATP-binding protein [Alteribacillus iranensis]SFE80255.1 iron(III) transport system ATP-binding protein [Alteribacillus iranensis]